MKQILIEPNQTERTNCRWRGVWKSGNPESGIGTGIETGTGTGTGTGTEWEEKPI